VRVWEFTVLIWCGATAAGFLGALTGLGGGVVIVPLLTVLMGGRYSLCDWGIARLGNCHL
jgi:uncharacterized membrane protein YfcA